MAIRKNLGIAVIGVCTSIALLCGCTARGRTLGPNNTNNTPAPQQQGIIGQRDNVGIATPIPGQRLAATPAPGVNPLNVQPTPQVMQDNRRKADNIKNQLATIKELDRVNIMVVGNMALVGYSPSNPSQDINATKNMIIDKVKQTDKSITNVTVSESADVMDRIGRLTTDMANNRPMNEITNEFNQIVRSIAPANR